MQDIVKRERSTNFSKSEVRLLTELVANYRTIIENKKTEAVTNIEKEATWNKIASLFNAASGVTARGTKSLKLKYESIKKETKKSVAKHRQQLYKTDGGPSSGPNFTEIEEKVMAICSNMTGIDARNDSDNIPEPILKETAKVILKELPMQTLNNVSFTLGEENDDCCLPVLKEIVNNEIANDEGPFLATRQPVQVWKLKTLKKVFIAWNLKQKFTLQNSANNAMEEIPSAVDESTCQEVSGCSKDSQDTPIIQETQAAKKPVYSRKRNIKCLENLVNKVKAVGDMIQTPMANNELNDNEFGIFGRGFAAQLNAMPLMLALQAQSHIQNYLISLRMHSLANPLNLEGYSLSPLSHTTYISSPSPTINSSVSGVSGNNNSTENLEVYSPQVAAPAIPSTVVINSSVSGPFLDDLHGDILEFAVTNSITND